MNLFSQILGWGAIILGLIAFVFQANIVAGAAIAVGIVCLFIKDIRGMGMTGIGFGITAFLMANIFS